MSAKKHVVVLGAGVTGLTSAVMLAEDGYHVTILAAHVPGDSSIEYTSPWAGAHWRTHASVDEPILCDWDVQTLDYWTEQLQLEKRQGREGEMGIKMYDSYDLWDSPSTETLWWTPYVHDFRSLLPSHEPIASYNARCPPDSPQITQAAVCQAPAINVPKYLLYLQNRALTAGAKVIKTRLPTSSGLTHALQTIETLLPQHNRPVADLYVNATGLGAAKLCRDTSMFPIRGQTVLVRGEASATRTRLGDGYVAYCIPRPGSGTTILGGTKEVGNWSEAVDADATDKILQGARVLAPELLLPHGGFEVVSVQCGLRPGREGGPRVEGEFVGGRSVVHAYGHAGAGYQNSIGCARLVGRLVREGLEGERARARL
ncbi:hypothetical protein MBLNU230_g8051t1 [Neophaeotheca triangularis]